MIDFTECKKLKKSYGGANGNKIAILYDNEIYMLKFPSIARKDTDLSYANGCISEYICCHIYEMLGIPAQKTILGTYNKNGKEKIVVACKDFEEDGYRIKHFAELKNTVLSSSNNGYGVELEDILNSIEEQTIINPEQLKERFWDMFIVDSLLGNFDRHNGNWGYLYRQEDDTAKLAPIFDCGSCLYSNADEDTMNRVINNVGERYTRIFNYPTSAIKREGKKIAYYDFLTSYSNVDCDRSIVKIYERWNSVKEDIYKLIDSVEVLTNTQRNFYRLMLDERAHLILKPAYEKATNRLKACVFSSECDFDEDIEEDVPHL
ncbi:MAG: HipA domain-containing protein [Lachnospiraceae bacterium]|nr:HipA domain-containing protein [Lachnospiraceae bacterium]